MDVTTQTYQFRHEHYSYVFCFARPNRIREYGEEAVCPEEVKVGKTNFVKIFEGTYCTYVCKYEKTSAASKATVNVKKTSVQSYSELQDLSNPIAGIFSPRDFSCVTTGQLVSLDDLQHILHRETEPTKITEMVEEVAVRLKDEPSRNEIIEQIIHRKLGDNFTVSSKPMVERKGMNFNPYAKSRQDLCIVHKTNFFKSGLLTIGMVTNSGSVVVSEPSMHGDVLCSVMEFKCGSHAVDQLLAEMLCTVIDCCVKLLKEGKESRFLGWLLIMSLIQQKSTN